MSHTLIHHGASIYTIKADDGTEYICEWRHRAECYELYQGSKFIRASFSEPEKAVAWLDEQAHENGLEIGERGRLRSTRSSPSPGNAPSAPVPSKGAGE